MAKSKTLYMETTSIDATKTAGEIMSKLVGGGARQIAMDYSPDGRLVGMSFVLEITPGASLPFKLPVRTESIFKILNDRRPKYGNGRMKSRELGADEDRSQAERIAWRQLLRWIEAQLAMIDVGMVQPAEVFMPYITMDGRSTMFEQLSAGGYKALLPAAEQ